MRQTNELKMKFSHSYILARDLPTYKKGWPFKWNGNSKKFYPNKVSTWSYAKGKPDYTIDMDHQGYTLEQIKNTEWFKPNSPEVDYIPAFPSIKKIDEFVTLPAETRLVNEVDFIRAFNDLLNDEIFQKELYEFYKKKYNQFHIL